MTRDREGGSDQARQNMKEIFEYVADQMATENEQGAVHHPGWGGTSFFTPLDEENAKPPIDVELGLLIRETPDWSDALAACLIYVNDHPKPDGRITTQRHRLRRFLNAVNHFMGLHPDLADLEIREDMALLSMAIEALNFESVHPLLDTKPLNKPRGTIIDQKFRAYIVAFVQILIQAGSSPPAAFKTIATEMTRAGFRASRPTQDDPSTDYRATTVERYYRRAQPAAEEKEATKNPSADLKPLLGQRDSEAVFKMLIGFVSNAIREGEPMPPSQNYALKIIRATLNEPKFKELFRRHMPGA